MRTVNHHSPPVPVIHGSASATAISGSGQPQSSSQQGLSLTALWQRLWRQKALFLTVLLLTLLFTVLVSWTMTPYFRAVSTVQIEKQGAQIVDFGELNQTTPDMGEFDPFFRTQYEQLKSRELAQRIIQQLNLQARLFEHDFNPPLKTALLDRFNTLFNPLLNPILGWINQLREDNKITGSTVDPVDEFLEHLYVEPVERTHLVKVFYETPDAKLSAEIVNALVKTFISERQANSSETDLYAQTFLELELEKSRDRLTASEEALVEYARENDILEVNNSQEAQEKKLTDLNASLVAAEQKKIEADSKLRQSDGSEEEALRNPVVEALKQQLTELEGQYQNQLSVFKPAYPDMQQLAVEIENVKSKLANEMRTVKRTARSSLQVESNAANDVVERLRDELENYKDQLIDLRDRSVEYNALQRELETNRKLYEDLLQRNKEVGVASGVTTSNISIIDKAQPPVKSFRPNKLLNILIALLAGLMLASAFALLREALRNSLSSGAELEQFSGLPILGTVPYVRRARQADLPLAALNDVGSAVAEAYRITAANLKFAFKDPGSRIFLVTSINPAAGKSTSSVNLALSKAQLGNKVLLIDADLRRPTVHSKMSVNNHLGLSEYLYGDIELVKATQHFAEASNTYVITAGLMNLDPVEALSCERMTKLIAMSRQYFDVVIIDAPPVTGFADTTLLAEYADGTVLVTDEEHIDRSQMTETLNRLQRVKNNVLGFLVVKSRKTAVADDYYQRYQRRPEEATPLMTSESKTGGLNLAR